MLRAVGNRGPPCHSPGSGAAPSGGPDPGPRSSPPVTVSRECRTARPIVAEQGLGPDLVHLECDMFFFRSFRRYRPFPRMQRFDVFGANGVILGTHNFAPESPELNAPSRDHRQKKLAKSKGRRAFTSFRPTCCSFSTK